MSFEPHPASVTHPVEYGNLLGAGYPLVPFALCEFIDNALTALRKMRESEPDMQPCIEILFVEPTGEWAASKKMAILIR